MTTNPKEAAGRKKLGFETLPIPVILELARAMNEGAAKYGAYNYRHSPVVTSVYFNAALRHLFSFWCGEDLDPESGISHVTKAMTSLMVLRDAMISGTHECDRPLLPKPLEFTP
jgi:hypothetical protein